MMVLVRHDANRSAALHEHESDFAGLETDLSISGTRAAVQCNNLSIATGTPAQQTLSANLQANAVYERADWDETQREHVTGTHSDHAQQTQIETRYLTWSILSVLSSFC